MNSSSGDCCIILNWKCLSTDSSGEHQLGVLRREYRCFCFQYNVNINIGKHCTLSLCCFYSINPWIPPITCNHHTFQKALERSDEMKTKFKCKIPQMKNDATALSANVLYIFFYCIIK